MMEDAVPQRHRSRPSVSFSNGLPHRTNTGGINAVEVPVSTAFARDFAGAMNMVGDHDSL